MFVPTVLFFPCAPSNVLPHDTRQHRAYGHQRSREEDDYVYLFKITDELRKK